MSGAEPMTVSLNVPGQFLNRYTVTLIAQMIHGGSQASEDPKTTSRFSGPKGHSIKLWS